MRNLSDRSIVDLCIAKDSSAWSAFVDRFSKLVYWAIRDRLTKWGYNFAEQDVEDIYQELFISLWEREKLAEIKDRSKISGWLVMVAGNAACDYFRRKKDKLPKEAASIFQNDTSKILHLKELKELLDIAIGSLPPRECQAITLHYLYGKKHREVAQVLKISVNTASTIIRRARALLKKELNKRGIKDF